LAAEDTIAFIMQIDAIREQFSQPPAEYSPTPFWFLNDNLQEDRIAQNLEELKAKGISSVIIHPRTGLEIEYLSPLYWERITFICESLKRLRMTGWLYDEYNWPSGPVGGKLLREHPEYKQITLDYLIFPPSRLIKGLQHLNAHVYAAFELSSDTVVEKTESILKRRFNDLSGDVLLFLRRTVQVLTHASTCAPWTRGEAGYLDVLNPAATDEFMRMTHVEYDRHIRRYYGDPIIGIFTDEPGNYGALPFSSILPAEYERRYHDKFLDCLPSLAGRIPGIPIEQQVLNRTRYFELARDMFAGNFFGKIAAWASERGLFLTGHLNEDDKINRLPGISASFFQPLSRMSMPGIDVLEDRHGFDRGCRLMAHPNFLPKAASSVSHHCGLMRTLCEIWGGNGWETSPERLKGVLNWTQACGVNFINPHAAFMSLRGLRKRDFPASHFPPQPWWRFYKKFSDYIARLSYLNSQGAHVAATLLAFPMKSLWAEFDLKAEDSKFADLIERVSETLLRNQLDFDFLFDEFLDDHEPTLQDGRIKIGEEVYSILLLPINSVIPEKLLQLAERFAAAGGKVFAFGYQLPAHNEFGHEISKRIEALFGGSKPENVEYHHVGTENDSTFSWLLKKLDQWLRRDFQIEGLTARNFAYLHRKTDGADIYFVANLSEQEGAVDLKFRCAGRPQLWNPEDGLIQDVLAYRTDNVHTTINRHFHPNEAAFFVFLDEPPVDHVDSTNFVLTAVTPDFVEGYASALEVRVVQNNKRYIRTVEQAYQPLLLPRRWQIEYPLRNILLLDQWKVEMLSEVERPKWDPHEDPRLGIRTRLILQALRKTMSFAKTLTGRDGGGGKRETAKYRRLSHAVTSAAKWSKILGIDPQNFEEAEGILLKMAEYAGVPVGHDYPPPASAYAMITSFVIEHVPEDLALVYEESDGNPVSIQLNGHEIDRKPEPIFIWDDSNRLIPLSTLVRKGANRLRLEWRQPEFPTLFPSVHGIEPVCLIGRFWVKKKRIVEQLYGAPAIPWADIGLPNFIGTMTYKASFKLPLKYIGQQLLLKFYRIHEAAEVKINDKYAGQLLWRPYVLDVTHLLKQGENSIEVTVANTAANLLGEPVPAGMIGRPYIVPYWRHRIRFR